MKTFKELRTQLDELSKKTLKSYMKKSLDNQIKLGDKENEIHQKASKKAGNDFYTPSKKQKHLQHKILNRETGMNRAGSKLGNK